jgi:heptosyltransferase II
VKLLIIQTAFLGDVILATSVIEKLHAFYPESSIDFLLRKGNESIIENHPFLNEVLIWDKKQNKYANLFSLINKIRGKKYNYIINLHRFIASGVVTVLGNAEHTIGFNKNPLSLFFGKRYQHIIAKDGTDHETVRCQHLVNSFTDNSIFKPKLYPSEADYAKVLNLQAQIYICIAPASVWFTKQFPKEKWVALIRKIKSEKNITIYLLGAPGDKELCNQLIIEAGGERVINLAGELSILQTAALMQGSAMNYVNDSAPMHIASSMNAPVTAIFCSTVPGFGFGPLSELSHITETKELLNCRPCGLHGFTKCPEGHFKCALSININDIPLPA